MIKSPLPAYVLAFLSLILLARRLDVLHATDAALWFIQGAGLLVALLTRAIGEREADVSPPPAPAPPGPGSGSPGGSAPPFRDLR
jgi:hypothetical protein